MAAKFSTTKKIEIDNSIGRRIVLKLQVQVSRYKFKVEQVADFVA